jgi:hypothetical protein
VIWVPWLIFGVGVLLLIGISAWLAVVVHRFRRVSARATSELRDAATALRVRAEALRSRDADWSRPEPVGQ